MCACTYSYYPFFLFSPSTLHLSISAVILYHIFISLPWSLYLPRFPLYTTLLQLTTTSIDSYGFLVFLVIVTPASTLIIYFRSRSPVLISKNFPTDTREFSDDSCRMEELVKVDCSLEQQLQ